MNWNSDVPGYSLNDDPLYSTLPYFIGIHSNSVFGIFFDNSYKSFFNFGGSTDDTMYLFGAEGGTMNYYFFGASTVSGQIRDYTWLTGRMELPPLWSLGYQQCRWSYVSQQQLLERCPKNETGQHSMRCYVLRYRLYEWIPDFHMEPCYIS